MAGTSSTAGDSIRISMNGISICYSFISLGDCLSVISLNLEVCYEIM